MEKLVAIRREIKRVENHNKKACNQITGQLFSNKLCNDRPNQSILHVYDAEKSKERSPFCKSQACCSLTKPCKIKGETCVYYELYDTKFKNSGALMCCRNWNGNAISIIIET